jgi:subtilisin family serine protease
VAASDASNHHAAFSNYGPEVDVTAPGVNIYSTALGGGYEYRSGTSMSTAYVTGEVALLLSINSGLTPDEVAYIVESTALDIDAPGEDNYTGSGLIQVDAAVLLVPATQVAQPEPEENRKPRDKDARLPSPTSDGSPLPLPTLPASTATDPEVSAQPLVIETPTVEVISSTPAEISAQDNLSNSIPSFLIGVLFGAIVILVFLWLRRKKSAFPSLQGGR